MPIAVRCECGQKLKARDESAGRRAECPHCGRMVLIPASGDDSVESEQTSSLLVDSPALNVTVFVDPIGGEAESVRGEAQSQTPVFRRMLEAMLDPRAIHWMLLIGGGLSVLGLIIWLVSIGIFDDPRHVAVALGAGSLAILGGGWATVLKTRYRLAGQALTFLGCVVAPLNLWFYHSQGLITIDQHLWVGGLVCVALYAATVRFLRDPIFMYAVEAGLTITTLLLMANLHLIDDMGHLAMFLTALGAISIHAERAFPVRGEFERKRYGMPLFLSGHAQLGVGLLMLMGSQVLGWLALPLNIDWPGNLVTQSNLLAGGLWIAGVWLYLYSNLVVSRKGISTYLAAASLVMAEVTLVVEHVNQEGFLAILALTALVLQIVGRTISKQNEVAQSQFATIGSLLAGLPVLMGLVLYRGTSLSLGVVGIGYESVAWFAGAMFAVAICNGVSTWMYRHTHPRNAEAHFYLSVAGLLVAVSTALNVFGWTEWYLQSPALMVLPLVTIVAARICRGATLETPLARGAHLMTAVIVVGSLVASIEQQSTAFIQAVVGRPENLYLGIMFTQTAVFYALAGWFRRRSWNAYLATMAACAGMWQYLGYLGVADVYYPLLYAMLGLTGLVVGRAWGVALVDRYDQEGVRRPAIRGPGMTSFQCGNTVVSIASIVAVLQGLGRLSGTVVWLDLGILLATTAAVFAAIWLVPNSDWRRWYATCTIALGAVCLLTLNVLVDLSGWQKMELFCVVVGLILLAVSHLGLFGEVEKRDDSISLGLWLGSLLAVVPLFVAMFYHRFVTGMPSLNDELALLTMSIAMLVTGCGWQVKSTTLLGGVHLLSYLVILVASVAYRPEVAVGVYLLVGGGVIFASGVLLSVYRDRLMQLPEMIAKRNGIFRVIGWR